MTVIELRNQYPTAKMYFKKNGEVLYHEPQWNEKVAVYRVKKNIYIGDEYENGKYVETLLFVKLFNDR